MRAVKVQYTTQSDYAATNAANIKKVMADLKAINNPGIKYSAFMQEDGKSFVHFAILNSDDANAVLNNLESFKSFQAQLKESGPETPPKVEQLSVIDSSYSIFGE